MGQDRLADAVLELPSNVALAVPDVCLMEAVSAFDWKRIDRNRLSSELDFQLKQLRRSSEVESAVQLVAELTVAELTNDQLLDELFSRFDSYVTRLANRAVLIPLSSEIVDIQSDLRSDLDRDDAMILASILDHARKDESIHKAFITSNVKDFAAKTVRLALNEVGVTYFSSSERAVQWLMNFHQ
jgi:hypothetical protein